MKIAFSACVTAVLIAAVGAGNLLDEENVLAMIEKCRMCSGDDGDDCQGCPTAEKPADDDVFSLFSAAQAEFLSQAQDLATKQGENVAIRGFVPIRYSTQVVNGKNWFVKVQLNSHTFADVEIWEPPYANNSPLIFNIKFGVERDAPISFPDLSSYSVEFTAGKHVVAMQARCMLCSEDDPHHHCSGCPSSEKPADQRVLELFSSYGPHLQSQAQGKTMQEGNNIAFSEFVPIRYSTQVVRGTEWYVKVQLDSDLFADVAIFEPLPYANLPPQPPEIDNIKFGVERDAPISVIPSMQSALMV